MLQSIQGHGQIVICKFNFLLANLKYYCNFYYFSRIQGLVALRVFCQHVVKAPISCYFYQQEKPAIWKVAAYNKRAADSFGPRQGFSRFAVRSILRNVTDLQISQPLSAFWPGPFARLFFCSHQVPWFSQGLLASSSES